jgi:broad specificity phosphatase PhoE
VRAHNFIDLSSLPTTLPDMVHGTPAGDVVADVADAQRVVWLVRHGESTWNAAGLAQGHCDQARLTERGVRQARDVAGQLGERPIGALYVSDLRRALATAAPLASALGLAMARDTRLRERCLGELEGAATAAVTAAVSGISENRVVDPDARPPGGESLRDFYRRVAGFAADLETRRLPGPSRGPAGATEIVIVAHGGTLRMLNACLRGVPVEKMGWEPLGNACILRSGLQLRNS